MTRGIDRQILTKIFRSDPECCNHPVTRRRRGIPGACCAIHRHCDRTDDTGECVCGRVNRDKTRIVGGQETEVGEYPWMVALITSVTSKQFCGGVLVNNLWVLTAAHCLTEANVIGPSYIKVLCIL